MVSLSMVKNQGIAVRLPTAVTGLPQERRVFVAISLAQDGALYLDKQPVALEDLGAKLTNLKAEDDRLRVFINGDEQALFGHAIRVMDEVRRAGIADVSIQTRQPSASSALTAGLLSSGEPL